MKNNALAVINFLDKYSLKKDNGQPQSWVENVANIYATHRNHLKEKGLLTEKISEILDNAEEAENKKMFLSSQRMRQWADPDLSRGVGKHNARLYNCAVTPVDRLEVFGEILYVLLCGAGVGGLLYRSNVRKIKKLKPLSNEIKIISPEDSIEGLADAVTEIFNEKVNTGKTILLNVDKLRKQGELIDGKFMAPDPSVYLKNVGAIIEILEKIQQTKTRKIGTVDAADIICYLGMSVKSGGVRRAACSLQYDHDDKAMNMFKSGDWWNHNQQRMMVNISARFSTVGKTKLTKNKLKDFLVDGVSEKGIVIADSKLIAYNPCFEIGMVPYTKDGRSGWQFCNLVEVPSYAINDIEKGKENKYASNVMAMATFMATVQATYNSFPYLGKVTEEITKRDALIGVSITGLSECNLSNTQLERLSELVKHYNDVAANHLKVNSAKRTTCVKPGGNSSLLLGVTSGIDNPKGHKVIRRLTMTDGSPILEWFLKEAPEFVVKMQTEANNEYSLMIPMEYNGRPIVEEVSPLDFIKRILDIQKHWVQNGGREEKESWMPYVHNNVSNTITINFKDEKMVDEACDLIAKNAGSFSGLSFLDADFSTHYPYLPYTVCDNGTVDPNYIGKDPFFDSFGYGNIADFNTTIYERLSGLMHKLNSIEEDLINHIANTGFQVKDASEFVSAACAGGSCELS